MENLTATHIASILMGLVVLFWMAPRILSANRGRVLQNIVLWLAIFAALGLVYKIFGPF